MLQSSTTWRILRSIAVRFGCTAHPQKLMFTALPHLPTSIPARSSHATSIQLLTNSGYNKPIRKPYRSLLLHQWPRSTFNNGRCCAQAAQAVAEVNGKAQSGHGLSSEQAAAVFAGEGHLRIIAGPGSGKTRVLTSRVEHLIRQKGCKPWQLVVITFSNKAARELQDRLALLLGKATANQIIAGTFHSVGCQIVRRHVAQLGDTGRETFAIFDQDDTKNVMKLALKKHLKMHTEDSKPQDAADAEAGAAADDPESSQVPEWAKPKQIERLAKLFRHDISLIKNGVPTCFALDGQSAVAKYNASSAAQVNRLNLYSERIKESGITIEQAYDLYEAELKQNRALDFDDLLGWPVALLERCPDLRARLQKRYKHILVDEFQDTNAPQYELVRLLAGQQASVFVVGDPDQAIYGWRGANVVNMERSFDLDYPGSQTLQLKDNYRSTPQVLRGAEGVLQNILSTGAAAVRLPLVPLNKAGPQIEVVQVANERAEAEYVVDCIQQLHESGKQRWRDVAVLYRTNAQARLFEEQLVRRNVPYQVIGGTPFWLRKEVKDVMAYVKLAVNPEDDVSLARVINQPSRGIGQESLQKLRAWAEGQGLMLGQALFPNYQACTAGYRDAVPLDNDTQGLLSWPDTNQLPCPASIPAQQLGLSKKASAGVEDFSKIIIMTRILLLRYPVAAVIQVLLDHINFEEFVLSGKTAKGQQNRWQNVQQVIGAAEHAALQPSIKGLDYLDTDQPQLEPKEGLAKVQDFLEQVALWSDPEKYALEESEDGIPDVVNVMTLHLSKGLEFNAVFIVGCEDALMPHGGLQEDVSDPRHLEKHNEEVRLLYVGMTRAKQQLYLLHARERAFLGGTKRMSATISPFLRGLASTNSASSSPRAGDWPAHQPFRRSMQTHSDRSLLHGTSSHDVAPATNVAAVQLPRTSAQERAARRRR